MYVTIKELFFQMMISILNFFVESFNSFTFTHASVTFLAKVVRISCNNKFIFIPNNTYNKNF